MSLRKLYYKMSPSMRLLARKIAYAPFMLIPRKKYSNGLNTPPHSLIFTGGGDFKETGERFLQYFKDHGLQKHHDLLDVGSGMGRMALPLTTYLEGTYHGLDIMEMAILWCQKNISSQYANFHFQHLDVRNDLYRNDGEEASETIFPIEPNTKDFCILISVFTHMLPDEMKHYLLEISKSLRVGGICFATYFIYQGEEELTENHFKPFHKQDSKYALMDEQVKGANVAYNFVHLSKTVEGAGFRIKYLSHGKWKKKESQEDFQDFLVLEKI